MRFLTIFILSVLVACSSDDSGKKHAPEELLLTYIFIGDYDISTSSANTGIETSEPIEIRFSKSLDRTSTEENVQLLRGDDALIFDLTFKDSDRLIVLTPEESFSESTKYRLVISSDLMGAENETFEGLDVSFTTLTSPIILDEISINDKVVNPQLRIIDVSRSPLISLNFNRPIDQQDLSSNTTFKLNGSSIGFSMSKVDDQTYSVSVNDELQGYREYSFSISENLGLDAGRPFEQLDLVFYTKLDSTAKFPEISDEDLLTKVQEQTFKYFWDFAHPISGLSRERNTSGELVTIGGSGFGVMSIIVGIERGFITRSEGVDRLETIVTFLENADRFHGVWPHWMNGTSGDVIPFSSNDDGADLVETAFMIQGLLSVREYLEKGSPTGQELGIISTINDLWEDVEWDWFQQNGEDVLYWHWSPNVGWEQDHEIQGWNEALIVYVLAVSSPTHSIEIDVYEKGWARNGEMVNTGNSYYGYTLPLRNDLGGPLFFSHYSFLGLDPRNLSDQYADYWEQNVSHSLINYEYCKANPQSYVGYKDYSWGLTASDNHQGYSAHSPNNDLGVITPTAALSSFPYSPEESMMALRHYYYILGDRLWGEYGFYDAFNVTENWYASSYLAIDQGPIIIMIENHRTQLLWNNFMAASEIQSGLTKLGFDYE